MWVQNPIIHPSHREVLFLYGANAAFTIRTHYELLRNSFSVRVVRISSFAGVYAHAWVQNPIIHPSQGEVLFAYGVNAALTIRTHYELLCNSYNLRVAGMKKFVQIIRANVGSESHQRCSLRSRDIRALRE